jgi:lipopolysaccharide export system permease protein
MILTALIIVVGEFIAPPAVQYAKLMRVAATEDFISLNTDYGLWARDSNNYIHVRSVKTDGSLVGISLYIFDNKQTMIKTVTAATGEYVGDHWLLKRVTIQDISDANIVRKGMKELRWDSLLSPDVVNVVSISPENLSIWKLRSYIDYLNDNQLDSSEYRLWFWSKLIAPFTIAAMVLLALPFVFGSLRNVGAGQRILVGFLLGLGFYIFNQLVAKLGLVYELPAVVAASLPTIVILVIAIVLLRRTR